MPNRPPTYTYAQARRQGEGLTFNAVSPGAVNALSAAGRRGPFKIIEGVDQSVRRASGTRVPMRPRAADGRSGARDRDRGLLQLREVEEVLEEVPGRRRPGVTTPRPNGNCAPTPAGRLPMRPADKSSRKRCGDPYVILAPGRGAFPGPSPSADSAIAELPLTPSAQFRDRAALAPPTSPSLRRGRLSRPSRGHRAHPFPRLRARWPLASTPRCSVARCDGMAAATIVALANSWIIINTVGA